MSFPQKIASSVVGQGRLASIDLLRGVAVLAVVITHLPFSMALASTADARGSQNALPPSVTQWTEYGMYGVHLFLVLSGFCIHLRWVRSGRDDAKVDFIPFWKRRLHRLYPPYFVALAGTLLSLFVFHGVLYHSLQRGIAAAFGYSSNFAFFLDLGMLLLLMQNVNGASQRIGNGPFWSLALEEQLYLLYFPLLFFRRRFGWVITFVVTLLITVLWRAAMVYFPWQRTIHWGVLGPAHWFEWMLGALAVEAYYDRVKLPAWIRAPWHLALTALLALVARPPHHWFPEHSANRFSDLAFGWFFFTLVHTFTFSRDLEMQILRSRLLSLLVSIGIASYSIYLTHAPVIVVAKWIGLKANFGVLGVLALRFASALAVGYAFHYLVERRFLLSSRKGNQ